MTLLHITINLSTERVTYPTPRSREQHNTSTERVFKCACPFPVPCVGDDPVPVLEIVETVGVAL